MGQTRIKSHRFAVAIVQLLAIALLQSHFLAPVYRQMFLSQGSTPKECHQDHRLCGCSPERVATKSCCCFRVTPSCCLSEQKDEECQSAQTGERHTRQKVTNSPCGSETVSAALSLDKLKFIFPGYSISTSQETSANSFPILTVEVPERFLEPPDPPPRLSIFS